MERFIFEVIEPLISKQLQQQRQKQRIQKITQELKAFTRGELVPINKELSKKTRQLFVAMSDIEKLKENIQHIEKECNKLRQQIAVRESQNFKQKISFEKNMTALQQEIDFNKKQIKKITKKYELDIEHLNQQNRDKIFDLKRDHRSELQKKLSEERTHWQTEVNSLKQTYSQQKSHLIQQTSKERSKIIKKYEEKLYSIKCQSDDNLQKITKGYSQKFELLRKAKGQLQSKLMIEQQNNRRLSLELQLEISQHRTFKMQFQSTFNELEGSRKRNTQERLKLEKDYEELKFKSKQSQRYSSERIISLEIELKSTTEQKDKRFIDTVEMMNTDHRIEVESLQSNMMEEREIAMTDVEVRAYEEMSKQTNKYDSLAKTHQQLQERYDNIKENYEAKFKKVEVDHQQELSTLQERRNYEFQLSGENSRRQYINLQAKFTLQIRSLKNQNTLEQQNLLKKAQQEKVALSNKLIGQYEAMLADQRSNTEIQIKQKLLQFERKAKSFDKRIAQGEKRKSELKVTIERMKLESQMKIQSMMQANQKLEEEVQSLHERILELQKLKSTIINDYEFKILLLKNEMDRMREEYHQRQDELRANLNEKIIVKNKQIARFAERIKQESQQLLKKHGERVRAIQKEYQQLKRVINQKTSLPEDIEALRIFHAAYLQKETQLLNQKRKREELQRELHSKDAIQKVFASKDAFKRLTAIDKLVSTSGRLSFVRQM